MTYPGYKRHVSNTPLQDQLLRVVSEEYAVGARQPGKIERLNSEYHSQQRRHTQYYLAHLV